MNFNKFNEVLERKLLPFANKLSTQRHLRAIRDSFISILPVTLVGGVVAVIGAAPVTAETTNGFLLAWADLAATLSPVLSWVSALTMGAMSLYITIGIAHFLSKHYKLDTFTPVLLSVMGFLMLVTDPIELGFASKSIEIGYLDGKSILPAVIISIATVESYRFMREKGFGRIKLPDSVPASLNETFASIVPAFLIILGYTVVFTIFANMGTTMPKFIYSVMAPTFQAADSLWFTAIMTILIHVFWFFGIHDASLAGILGPIRDGNLSINAAAHLAGEAMPHVFTTSFWVYFVIIGGCGSVLSLAILLVKSKSKQLRTVGKIGIIPSFFGISEPIIFGVPIMLNPLFFIPFVLTSLVNGIISFILMSSGIIGKTFAMLSWNMPSVFGAPLSTMDINAGFLIVGLIILDMLIYFPFFKVYEKQLVALEQNEATN